MKRHIIDEMKSETADDVSVAGRFFEIRYAEPI
jgi:hypothetical protein